MSVYAGKDGYIKVDSDTAGYMDNFSLSINGGTAEVSSLGSRAKVFIPTIMDWSGSMSGTLDTADAAQAKLYGMFLTGGIQALVEIGMCVGAKILTGNAAITSISVGVSHGDKVTFSANFQGSGELTESSVSA